MSRLLPICPGICPGKCPAKEKGGGVTPESGCEVGAVPVGVTFTIPRAHARARGYVIGCGV